MTNHLDIKEEEVITETYQELYHTFDEDYLRANPVRKLEGQIRFLEAKCKCGDITEEELAKIKQEIEDKGSNNEAMYKLNYTSKQNAALKAKKKLQQYQNKIVNKVQGAGGVINSPNVNNNNNNVLNNVRNQVNQMFMQTPSPLGFRGQAYQTNGINNGYNNFGSPNGNQVFNNNMRLNNNNYMNFPNNENL